MKAKLGKSIYLTHLFTERVLAKTKDETFRGLLEAKDDLVFAKIRSQFENRINKLFLHPSLGDKLDSGEIDFEVMNIFEELVKADVKRSGSMATTFYARNELIVSPLFEALFDCNIIYKSKYYDWFVLENKLYVHVMREWLEQRKQSMNKHEKILYYLFRKSRKAIKLGPKGGTPGPTKFTIGRGTSDKADPEWELKELYFDAKDE